MSKTTSVDIIIGVDTHKDVHAAVAINAFGSQIASTTVPASSKGFRELETWATSMGPVQAVGIEGTGSYCAGLCRFLREKGHAVIEVNRPNRQLRHRKGKNDTILICSPQTGLALDAKIREHDAYLETLTAARAPDLLRAHGMAKGTAIEMLLLIGDNPERIRSEAALPRCAAPVRSRRRVKTNRHRLNRGGNQQANAALYRVVIVPMRGHQPTLDYVRRRIAEENPKSEIIRCLKRFGAARSMGYFCR